MHNTAISIARISVSGSALCFGLLLFTSNNNIQSIVALSDLIRVMVAIAGLIFTVSTALLLDWSLDSLSDEEWKSLLTTDETLPNNQSSIEKADKLYSRLRVFGGGYMLLAFGLGCIAATIIWLAHPAIDTVTEIIFMGAAAISAFVFIFVIMLTNRVKSALIPLILVAVFIVIVVAAYPLSEAIGLTKINSNTCSQCDKGT